MTISPAFIASLPKAELHLHIEGTLSLGMKRELAARNRLDLGEDSFTPLSIPPGSTGQALDIAQYKMFLGLYFEGLKVLHTERDFCDVMLAYLDNCHANNVVYAEIFFDPQAHTGRGIPFDVVMAGLIEGQRLGRERHGIESHLIMCINRDLTLESAEAMMREARPWRDRILGLGLDNVEHGHPPNKFRTVYDAARDQGLRLTAHCDVDMVNAVEHVRQCIEDIRVERIDHGLNVMDDPRLVEAALDVGIHFTACPTWRVGDAGPRRVARIKAMRDRGLSVSLNSDDPGYFISGYMNNLLEGVAIDGNMGQAEVAAFVRKGFEAAWIDPVARATYLARFDAALATASGD